MPFQKGNPDGTAGRPKGTKNKSTVAGKILLNACFDELGGLKALVAWAQEEPGEFYKIWAKSTIAKPIEVSGGDTPVRMVIVTGVPDSEAMPRRAESD